MIGAWQHILHARAQEQAMREAARAAEEEYRKTLPLSPYHVEYLADRRVCLYEDGTKITVYNATTGIRLSRSGS